MAEETCTPGALATWEEPTGSAVPMYSVTTASRMAARRAFEGAVVGGGVGVGRGVGGRVHQWCLALKSTECQGLPLSHGPWAAGTRSGGVTQSSPRRKAEMKASWGTSTRPMFFIFFLPSFCFSSSLRFRLMSPP